MGKAWGQGVIPHWRPMGHKQVDYVMTEESAIVDPVQTGLLPQAPSGADVISRALQLSLAQPLIGYYFQGLLYSDKHELFCALIIWFFNYL